MKLLAVNGSPRKKHNTGKLLEKIVEGAAASGAQASLAHLREYNYSGCISCFLCKDPKGKCYGRCGVKDGLTPLLEQAHEADVLVLGSPFYFSTETSYMRAFMERLWFQYYLYTLKKPPLSPKKKATALVYTMNVKQEDMAAYGKDAVIAVSQGAMQRLFGSCEVFLCCDTAQFDDFGKYETDVWDVSAKLQRQAEVFPRELEQAFALGQRLVRV